MKTVISSAVVLTALLGLGAQGAYAQSMDLVLKLSERVPVAELAANVTDPNSPRYEKFYTPEEIRAYAAPSDADYADLLSRLQSDGFEIVSQSKTHLAVTIRGDHSLVESVFGTRIQFRGAHTFAKVAEATIPSGYSVVESVKGLDNTYQRKPHYRFAEKSSATAQGGILPAQIKTVYGFNPIYSAGINGTGEHIAIATYMGFHIEDVQAYYTKVGLSPLPTVDQVTFNGTPVYDDNSAVETQLDSEFTGMMAPGASIHVFASADNSDAGEFAMFTAILDDNRAQVVNYSWGGCEVGLDPQHKTDMDGVYQRAVAQGVNIMVASGDSGSDGCQNGTTAADWPATSPAVVAVGGTTLKISGSSKSEIAWGYLDKTSGAQEGSGGGISTLYSLPSWQSSLPSPFLKRSFPDVAFNADPQTGEAVWTHLGKKSAYWLVLGGTSMAAPQWTGFLTLVNAARKAKGRSSLGYLNPIIYGASAAERAGIFNDVTSGSNGAYKAGSGWDATTGWGSMQASAMLNFLVTQ